MPIPLLAQQPDSRESPQRLHTGLSLTMHLDNVILRYGRAGGRSTGIIFDKLLDYSLIASVSPSVDWANRHRRRRQNNEKRVDDVSE
jgi:hypothetical protein